MLGPLGKIKFMARCIYVPRQFELRKVSAECLSHNSPNSGAPLGGRDELWVGLLRLKGQVFDCLAPFSQSLK